MANNYFHRDVTAAASNVRLPGTLPALMGIEGWHLGRTTQVWDATVCKESTHNTLALFRCTQMVLWPK